MRHGRRSSVADGQAASLWEVLAEQAVEVLIAATFPGTMGICEVAAYARRALERFVTVQRELCQVQFASR